MPVEAIPSTTYFSVQSADFRGYTRAMGTVILNICLVVPGI